MGDKDQWRFVWMTSPDGNIASLLVRNGNTVKTWRWRCCRAIDPVAGRTADYVNHHDVLLGRELAPLNKLALALRMRTLTRKNH